MPFERSNPSEITGEKDVFSCTRSISLQTCFRPFSMTASVTGSSGIDRTFGLRLCSDVDDEVAELVDLRPRAWINDDRRIRLLTMAGPEIVAPCASASRAYTGVSTKLPSNRTGLFVRGAAASSPSPRPKGEVDRFRRPNTVVRKLASTGVISGSSIAKRAL